MDHIPEIESTTRAGQLRVDVALAFMRAHPDALSQFFADVRAIDDRVAKSLDKTDSIGETNAK